MNYNIDKFNELGYVIVTDFMSKEDHFNINQECHTQTALATSLDSNRDGWVMNSPNNPCKLDGAFKANNTFRSVSSNPTLKSIATKILGNNEIDTYISKFFPMVPKEGFSVDWHQDNYYIKADSSKLVSCDFFVNGATKENGCLRIIPESHKKIHDHEKESHGFFRWMSVNEVHPSIIDIEMEQPFAVFFDVNLVHGCYRNTSEASYRYSIAWEYIDRTYIPKTHNGHQSQDRLRVQ